MKVKNSDLFVEQKKKKNPFHRFISLDRKMFIYNILFVLFEINILDRRFMHYN